MFFNDGTNSFVTILFKQALNDERLDKLKSVLEEESFYEGDNFYGFHDSVISGKHLKSHFSYVESYDAPHFDTNKGMLQSVKLKRMRSTLFFVDFNRVIMSGDASAMKLGIDYISIFQSIKTTSFCSDVLDRFSTVKELHVVPLTEDISLLKYKAKNLEHETFLTGEEDIIYINGELLTEDHTFKVSANASGRFTIKGKDLQPIYYDTTFKISEVLYD